MFVCFFIFVFFFNEHTTFAFVLLARSCYFTGMHADAVSLWRACESTTPPAVPQREPPVGPGSRVREWLHGWRPLGQFSSEYVQRDHVAEEGPAPAGHGGLLEESKKTGPGRLCSIFIIAMHIAKTGSYYHPPQVVTFSFCFRVWTSCQTTDGAGSRYVQSRFAHFFFHLCNAGTGHIQRQIVYP